MRYEKDAAKKGKSDLTWGLGIVSVFIALNAFIYMKEGSFSTVLLIFSTLFCLFGFALISSGLSLVKSGGKWEIVLDASGINWKSPNEAVEQSFNYRYTEIDHVKVTVIKYKKRKGSTKESRRYEMVLKNGASQKLKSNSGVNLAQIVTELERHSVVCETVHINQNSA